METPEDRAQLKASQPKVILNDEHVNNAKIVPSRERLLDLLPKGGVVAEIGVAYGDFTRDILTRAAPSKLHLLDAWALDRYSEGKRKVEEAFSAEIASGAVALNQGYSTQMLETFPDGYFDWVYIDTSHAYRLTSQELLISSKKVKPRGRILGHDFTSGNVITPVPYGVIEACNEFCMKQGWQYEYLTLEFHGHFTFCLKSL